MKRSKNERLNALLAGELTADTRAQELLLEEARRCNGIVMEVARRIGINYTSTLYYTTGTANPTWPNLQKIADYFKVPVEELTGGDKEEYYREVYKRPATPEPTPQEKVLLTVWGQLSEEKRREALKYLMDLI